MANIAQGETKCYTCHKTLIKRAVYFIQHILYKQSGSVLLYFTLAKVYSSLVTLMCQ